MTLEKIKRLRERSGTGIIEVKKALEESGGNEEKALEILRKKGMDKADERSQRSAGEGVIGFYIHSNRKVAAMVKLLCETDFVARNEEFQELAHDLAMHIVGMNPLYRSPDEVAKDEIEKEKEIWRAQLEDAGKKGEIMHKALQGKEKKYREEISLLTQPFVKNPDVSVQELINGKISKIGENIQVGEFVRFEL